MISQKFPQVSSKAPIRRLKGCASAALLNNIQKGSGKLKINIHAGHNPDGKIACGAVGLIKESTEARNVKDRAVSLLKQQGHTVYDCTVDNGTSQNDVLKKIVKKCNSHAVDLDVSIHFNSGANKTANGATTGTEVYVYSSSSKAKPYAQNIVNTIASLGFKNRGVKYSASLYILKNINSPSLLIEVCFVDDPDDVRIYHADKAAQAIVTGITQAAGSPAAPPPATGAYQVKLLDNLNIRKTPNGPIVQVNGAKKGSVYTIMETAGTWGRLKSGTGWINISEHYVMRV